MAGSNLGPQNWKVKGGTALSECLLLFQFLFRLRAGFVCPYSRQVSDTDSLNPDPDPGKNLNPDPEKKLNQDPIRIRAFVKS